MGESQEAEPASAQRQVSPALASSPEGSLSAPLLAFLPGAQDAPATCKKKKLVLVMIEEGQVRDQVRKIIEQAAGGATLNTVFASMEETHGQLGGADKKKSKPTLSKRWRRQQLRSQCG